MSKILIPFFGLPTVATVAAEKPNILLIVADDLGFSNLGSYGGEIDTPVLEQLASEGVVDTAFPLQGILR